MGYETRERIRVLKDLGRSERSAGEFEAARSLYEEAVLLCRAEGHAVLLAHTLRELGDIQRNAGRLDRAQVCYDEALAIYRQEIRRRPLDVAQALRSAALLCEATGDPDAARDLWEEARLLYGEVGVQEGIDECCSHLTPAL
jgi:tetratricopeptide (TPR) repeat protein